MVVSFYGTSREIELWPSEWEVENEGVHRFLLMEYTFHRDHCVQAHGIKIDLQRKMMANTYTSSPLVSSPAKGSSVSMADVTYGTTTSFILEAMSSYFSWECWRHVRVSVYSNMFKQGKGLEKYPI